MEGNALLRGALAGTSTVAKLLLIQSSTAEVYPWELGPLAISLSIQVHLETNCGREQYCSCLVEFNQHEVM